MFLNLCFLKLVVIFFVHLLFSGNFWNSCTSCLLLPTWRCGKWELCCDGVCCGGKSWDHCVTWWWRVRKYLCHLTMSLCEAPQCSNEPKTLSSLKTMGNNKFASLGIMIHALCQVFSNPLFYFLLFAIFRWYW